MNLAETATAWLTAARKSGELSKRTTEGYAYCLGLLVRAGFLEVEELTRERLGPWLDTRRGSGIDPATLNRNLAAICSFCSMLERRGQFPLERLWGLRRLRYRVPPRKPPFFLTRELIPRVEQAAAQVDRQVFIALVLDVASGVRASELTHLHHEDLHLEEEKPFLVVARDARRDVKTYRSRTVPLRRRDAERLLELGLGRGRDGPVFPPEKHNATSPYLQENTLGRRLAVARAVVGPIGGKLDFLTLRHTFASWHVQAGVSIAKVARWLGNCVAICERHYAALAPGGDLDCERAGAA
jgi:integrase